MRILVEFLIRSKVIEYAKLRHGVFPAALAVIRQPTLRRAAGSSSVRMDCAHSLTCRSAASLAMP